MAAGCRPSCGHSLPAALTLASASPSFSAPPPLRAVLYPLLGRWWCSVCPFMVTGDLVQSWRAKLLPDVKFLKWPKKAAEEAGPWFVVGLFAGEHRWRPRSRLSICTHLPARHIAARALVCVRVCAHV